MFTLVIFIVWLFSYVPWWAFIITIGLDMALSD